MKDHETSREDVHSAVQSLIGVVSHSLRGLPGQNDDGTYDEEEVHPSMWKELRSLGFKDVKTLKDQLETGTNPIDDKTMLVSHTMLQSLSRQASG